MIPARQLWLQLGPDSHFDLLHGQHGARVALAHKDAGGLLEDRVSPEPISAHLLIVRTTTARFKLGE